MDISDLVSSADKRQERKACGRGGSESIPRVDDNIALVLHFQQSGTLGVATSSLRAATDVNSTGETNTIRIQGSRGEICVAHPAFQPTSFTLVKTSLVGDSGS